jgi:uncharacterized membrane protein YjjP (DUF1212 family)
MEIKEQLNTIIELIRKQHSEDEEQQHEKNYIKRYLFEVLEAYIALTILTYIKGNKMDFYKIFLPACVIGLVTLILEEFNPNFSSNLKSGMSFTAGSSMIGGG